MKKLFRFFVLLVLLAAAGVAAALFWPVQLETPQVYLVEPGWGALRITHDLVARGIVRRPEQLELALLARHLSRYKDGRIKTGEYEFSGAVSAWDAAGILLAGKVKTYKVTVVPGETVAKALQKFTAAGLFPAPAPAQANALADEFEGAIKPDTYLFSKPLTAAGALAHLRAAADKFWTPEREAQLKARGLTKREIVTSASIIERETALNAERPVVSAVIANRLKLGMPLQTDPVNIYGLERAGRYHGVVGHDEMTFETPYNSYTHAGLPPGPIGAPGEASLDAALNPANSRALYFVADGTGGHQFADTYEEHLRNVARWRKVQEGK